MQLRALEREAKAQRDLLESYLAKYREATARDSLGAVPADARIISRALVSNTPYFPKKLPIVLIATLATLFISAGFITTGELLAGNVYRAERRADRARDGGARRGAGREPVEPAAPVAPAAKRRWMPALSRKSKPVARSRPKVTARRAARAARAAQPRRGRRPKSLTIDEMARALREAGETGKRIAVVGAVPHSAPRLTAIALARALAARRARRS